MESGEGKSRGGVVERCSLPARGGMAGIAGRRKTGRRMARVTGILKLFQVTA